MFLTRFFSALSITTLAIAASIAPATAAVAPTTKFTPNLSVSEPFEQNTNHSWYLAINETENGASVVYKNQLYFEIYNYNNSQREFGRLTKNGLVESMFDKGIPVRPIGTAAVLNGYLFFTGLDAELGEFYIYRFDGTTTVKVSSVRQVNGRQHMAVLDGILYFVGLDRDSLELGIYKIVNNQSSVKVIDFTAANVANYQHYLVPFNGYLYFLGVGADTYRKFWKFDGNVITKAFDLIPGESDYSGTGRIEPVVYQDRLLFPGVAITGSSERKVVLYSLDKQGNIRTYMNPDSSVGASFKLQVFGEYLYGLYISTETQGPAIFRFNGKSFDRVLDASPSMSSSSLIQVKGGLYFIETLPDQVGQLKVIEGLKAKPVRSALLNTYSPIGSGAVLGTSNSLVFQAKDSQSIFGTANLTVEPRLWLPLKNGRLTTSQTRLIKSFMKTNKAYKRLTCTVAATTLTAATRQGKTNCKTALTGTKFKSTRISEITTEVNQGISLVLSK